MSEGPGRPEPGAHLAILVWGASPERPELCATPFYFAAAAAAMDVEVEMYFAAAAVRLLAPGVAEALVAAAGEAPPLAHFLAEAHRLGVRLYACPAALAAHGLPRDALRAEVSGIAGAAAFLDRALDPAWRTLTF